MNKVKKIVMPFSLLIVMGVIGYLLLVMAYSLPTSVIEKNVKESCIYFEKSSRNLMDTKSSTLDNFTDALMLLIAAHQNGDEAWEAAIDCANYEKVDMGPEASLIAIYGEEESPDLESPYGRYWHGYLIFLKPLLILFNYGEIRSVLMFLQLGLFVAVLLKVREKKKELIIPIFLLWIFLNPIATMLSLQYNTMYLITFGFMLFILLKADKWKKEQIFHWILAFFIAGALTSYFDLLTYPLLSLGVPLVLWLVFNYSKQNWNNIKNIILLCASWGSGYGGMWALKWIIGDLLTDSHIISSAIEAILFRTSSNLEEIQISYYDVLKEQITYCFQDTWLVALIIILLLFVINIMRSKSIELISLFFHVLISMFPFVWYYVLKNHSYIHGKFTYRILGISLFAMTTYIFINNRERKK